MVVIPEGIVFSMVAIAYVSGIGLLRRKWNKEEAEEKNSMMYGERRHD